jgi:hypothetical protein
MKQNLGRLELSVRYLHLTSPGSAADQSPQYFSANRSFREADTVTVAAYQPLTNKLKLYSDATLSHTEPLGAETPAAKVPLSWLSGIVWEGPKLTFRANYGSQSTSYLPVLGYYAGDRRGPYGDIRYKLFKNVDLTANALQSRNNLENNPAVATLRAKGVSGGVSISLPWRVSISGDYSTYTILTANPPALGGDQLSKNSQYAASLTKTISRHSLAWTVRELDLGLPTFRQKQRTTEFGDTLQFKRFNAGASVRVQQTDTGQVTNSVFFRGSLTAHFGPVNAYVQAELGNDLINKTVFATNTVNTTVAGVSVSKLWGWTLQAEVFRNSLTTSLNSENIFLLETQGQGVSTLMTDLNTWSAYVRLSKRFKWGGPLPEETERFAHDQLPLFGTVMGFVREPAASGTLPVAQAPVVLDGSRKVLTDATGQFTFSEVPEGPHRIELSPSELPAQFSAGEHGSQQVAVRARKTARVDLDVIELAGQIEGQISGGPAASDGGLDGVVLTLMPGGRQTTSDASGHFAFYNLRAGEYQVVLDAGTLPESYVLASIGEVKTIVTNETPGSARFAIGKRDTQPRLKVRKVFGGQGGTVQ